jgi:anti-anti-sigma factor
MAQLNVTTRQAGNVTILDLSGQITIGDGSVTFRAAVRDALDQGKKSLLLNFAEVSHVDSSGLGELVSSYTTATSLGSKLKLLNLPRKLQDLLMITKLLTVFETYTDEAEALQSFE